MSLRRRDLARAAVGGAVLQGLAPALRAVQAAVPWPSRPLHLFVVYPAGGVSDATARALADQLAPALGKPVLVENRAGAGGSVGIEALARATPDGHTLAFSALSPVTLHPLLVRTTVDPMDTVVPVASVMRTPVLVAATPAFAGPGFDDLIAQARAHPGAVRWASSGVATVGHMVLAQVRMQSRTAITHVPYQGGGRQLNDALGGQFEVLSTNVAALQLAYIRAGRLRALAVGAPERLDVLPEVPTLAELGYPQANLVSLFGIFAPARTPAAVVARLNAEINRALDSELLTARLSAAHNIAAHGSVEDFAREAAEDRRRNRSLVRGLGTRRE